MKQTVPIKSMIAVGLGASAAMWLSSKSNRIKMQSSLRDIKHKIKPSPLEKAKNLPVTKGGNPHPYDIGDNKMVDEGAQYSVQYFNEKMQ